MKRPILTLLATALSLFAIAQNKADSIYVKTVTMSLSDYQKLNFLSNAYQSNVIWNPYMKDTKTEQQNVIGYLIELDKRIRVDSIKVAKPKPAGK